MLGGWPRSSLALYQCDVQQILLCCLVKLLPMWASLDLAFVEALLTRDICKVGLGVLEALPNPSLLSGSGSDGASGSGNVMLCSQGV